MSTTQNKRVKSLLLKGYFPSQLPPAFNTRLLALNIDKLQTTWKINEPKAKAPACKPELFSVARAGHQRRTTSITNPIPQIYLSIFIARHWIDFINHYRKSRLSASHPRFIHNGDRAACIPSMQRLHERKVLESAGFKYMLRTDVSRFFPTIYTHSVPWALHTKSASKKNRAINPEYFGNLIDQAIRQGQDEQTMGLPIGPDTSHIIAEAISTAIDLTLKESLKYWPAGFRYVDDYFLFFPTITEAEAALASLSKALKEYELQINFEKTKICSVANITDDYWTHKLRNFTISSKSKKQRSDIHHFFELAKNLASRNADENVMTYALKRVSSSLVKPENWDAFEAHLCHTMLSHPNTLQTAAQILATYKFHEYKINDQRIQRTLNALITEHAALNHHSEIAWCLWMCKELSIKIDLKNIDLLSAVQSSVCALLLMDISTSQKLEKDPNDTFWRSIDEKNSLKEEFWLMCYEAGTRKWGGFTKKHISSDTHFKTLYELEVKFYDQDAKSKLLFNIKPGILERLRIPDLKHFFELEDAENHIDYEEENGGYENIIFIKKNEDDDEDFEDLAIDDNELGFL